MRLLVKIMDLQARLRWPGLSGEKYGRPEEKQAGGGEGGASSCIGKKKEGGREVVHLLGKPRLSERCEALRRKFMLFAVSVSWSIVHYCPRPSFRGANTFLNDNLPVLLYALSTVHLSVSKERARGNF